MHLNEITLNVGSIVCYHKDGKPVVEEILQETDVEVVIWGEDEGTYIIKWNNSSTGRAMVVEPEHPDSSLLAILPV